MFFKRILFFNTLMGVLSIAANAADLPTGVSTPTLAVPPAFTWTGFYAGGNVGGARGSSNFFSIPLPTPASSGLNSFRQNVNDSGVIGGGQIGSNYQMGSIVLGIEADIQARGIRGTDTLNGLSLYGGGIVPYFHQSATGNVNWFGTLRGRLGYALDRVLIFATGGLITGGVSAKSLTTFNSNPKYIYAGRGSSTNVGWTFGGGLEYALTDNWSAKIEGLYYDLGTTSYVASPLAANPPYAISEKASFTGGMVRLGINYKLGN
jgi:outer membrane immunogenic protein